MSIGCCCLFWRGMVIKTSWTDAGRMTTKCKTDIKEPARERQFSFCFILHIVPPISSVGCKKQRVAFLEAHQQIPWAWWAIWKKDWLPVMQKREKISNLIYLISSTFLEYFFKNPNVCKISMNFRHEHL